MSRAALLTAIKAGDLAETRRLVEANAEPTDWAATVATQGDHVHILTYLHDVGWPFNHATNLLDAAVKACLGVLDWYQHNTPYIQRNKDAIRLLGCDDTRNWLTVNGY